MLVNTSKLLILIKLLLGSTEISLELSKEFFSSKELRTLRARKEAKLFCFARWGRLKGVTENLSISHLKDGCQKLEISRITSFTALQA